MEVELASWLEDLRRVEIVHRVQNDPRSSSTGSILGHGVDEAKQAAGWGQAAFDEPWNDLRPTDRVLLYAYFFQIRHLQELTVAFHYLFKRGAPDERPVVIDLGCGPFTGALALAGVLGSAAPFDYLAVDRSRTMLKLGKHLVACAKSHDHMLGVRSQCATKISSISWSNAPAWRPVFVIISYLLASPTLEVERLVTDLNKLLGRIGRGHVTVLYTNSPRSDPNRRFNDFSKALHDAGFGLHTDEIGKVRIESRSGPKEHELRWALFDRKAQKVLRLKRD